MTSMLRIARERGGMSIEDVATKLKIRRQYLIALEEGKLTEIPGEVYAQGYLKMYATYLGVDFNVCHIQSEVDNSSSFWSRAPERIGQYSGYKVIISLFIMGILCIFCWHSLTDKVVPDGALGLLDRLGKHDAGEEAGKYVVDHNLVDTTLGRVPTQESK